MWYLEQEGLKSDCGDCSYAKKKGKCRYYFCHCQVCPVAAGCWKRIAILTPFLNHSATFWRKKSCAISDVWPDKRQSHFCEKVGSEHSAQLIWNKSLNINYSLCDREQRSSGIRSFHVAGICRRYSQSGLARPLMWLIEAQLSSKWFDLAGILNYRDVWEYKVSDICKAWKFKHKKTLSSTP